MTQDEPPAGVTKIAPIEKMMEDRWRTEDVPEPEGFEAPLTRPKEG